MNRRFAVGGVLVCGLTGCGAVHVDEQQLATIAFELPASWQRTDTRVASTQTAVFDPPSNARKETITVIRAAIGPIAAQHTPSSLGALLAGAQTSLAEVHISALVPITTNRGFRGVQLEVDFVPQGRTQHYHRVHAVFVDGSDALVHVLYTAASPDPTLAVFHQVLDSLHEDS